MLLALPAGPHRPRGCVQEDPVEPGHHLRRRPALRRPGAETVRKQREGPVRPEQVEERLPLLRRHGRRRHGSIAEEGREVEEPVVREREQGVRRVAGEGQALVELAEPGRAVRGSS